MCLGVPGRVLAIEPDPLGMNMGKVSFAGITKRVCLAYTPDARVGDYVVVHVGFAISRIDEAEAGKVFEFLAEMDELGELDIPQPAELAPGESSGAPS
jgi:hydrogenase expression/formation protein HypC